jgi:hypothetical protein
VFGRISRTALDIVGTLVVLTLIGIGIFGWLLSQGPISLSFLTPLVERALSRDDDTLDVDIDDTVLAWAGWRRTVDIRVRGIHVLGPSGRLMLEVPEASVSFSARALLRGMVAPTAIDVTGVRLRLVRARDGAIRFGFQDAAPDAQADTTGPVLLSELLAPPDPDRRLGYLQRLSILEGSVEISDEASGRTWSAREAEIALLRDAGGLRAEAVAAVDLGAKPSRINATGAYRTDTARLDLSVRLLELEPSTLAAFDPVLKPLAGIHVPISGTVDLGLDPEFRIADARFSFIGEAGRLAATSFDLPRDVPVRRFAVRGALPKGTSEVTIEEFTLDLAGPVITLTGRLSGLGEKPRAEGQAVVRNVPTDDLRRLWPRDVAKNARDWIVENLSGGRMSEARASFALSEGAKGWVAEKVGGTLQATGVDIQYLKPMPAIRGVDGRATFDATRFDIATTGGAVGNLRAGDGKIALYDLDTDIEKADIQLPVAGPVREAVTLVDGPPLGFLKKIDLKPEDFGGDAAIQLALKFPLKKDLKVDEIDVLTTAEVKNFTQRKAALDQDVSAGDMKLRVDQRGLDVSGRVLFGGVPATVEVRREFADNAPIIGRTRARGRVGTAERRAFGFDFDEYVDGPADIAVEYIERRGSRNEAIVDATLTGARMMLTPFEWEKAPGKPATARARVAITNGKAVSLPEFSVQAGDPKAGGLIANGTVALGTDGKSIARADLPSFRLGVTDVRASFVRKGTTLGFTAAGPAFDVGPFQRDKSPRQPDRPGLELHVDVERLYFDADRLLYAVRFDGLRTSDRWETVDLAARTGSEMTLNNQVAVQLQSDAGHQTLMARAEDAGAFLRAVDITPNVVGGRIEAHGLTDSAKPGRPIVGKLRMSEFRTVRAPILARVLSVALLTGVLDSLSGEGIRFAGLEADFAYADPRLDVLDAKASGSSLGVTARGTMNLDADTVELDGTIVPANALNSLPGRIPLIGNLLTGGGGGVFAATYRVSGALGDPRVTVNPLSALAPGFLRNLFGIFSLPGESPTGSTPQSELEGRRD